MSREKELVDRVKASGTLMERLYECRSRIGAMCSERRPPRMTIPTSWCDDDFFITTTLQEAREALSNRATLTFAQLRSANNERAQVWTHNGPPTPLAFAIIELCGEAGELANAVKKHLRHEMGMVGGNPDLQAIIDEVADVVICADLVARKLGIDLGEAVAAKFNATSRKHGFRVMLESGAA